MPGALLTGALMPGDIWQDIACGIATVTAALRGVRVQGRRAA